MCYILIILLMYICFLGGYQCYICKAWIGLCGQFTNITNWLLPIHYLHYGNCTCIYIYIYMIVFYIPRTQWLIKVSSQRYSVSCCTDRAGQVIGVTSPLSLLILLLPPLPGPNFAQALSGRISPAHVQCCQCLVLGRNKMIIQTQLTAVNALQFTTTTTTTTTIYYCNLLLLPPIALPPFTTANTTTTTTTDNPRSLQLPRPLPAPQPPPP